MRQRINTRVLGVGGAILLLPVLLSIFLGMNKQEGAVTTSTAAPATKVSESPVGVMSDIPAAANTVLVKYIDALTTGLHTGSPIEINRVTEPGCPCRIIGESFQAIYTKANLVGGAYSLKRSTVIKKSESEIQLKVVIKMTDTTHIVRKTGAKELWKGTDITAYFTLTKAKNIWKIRTTSVKP